MTFDEFLPEYLEAHSDPRTRAVHAAGLLTGLAIALTGIVRRKPRLLLRGLAVGYIPAWISHLAFEGNIPKTFEHPFLSFRGDFVMVYRMLTGQLAKEG
jgi:hypothetical protein